MKTWWNTDKYDDDGTGDSSTDTYEQSQITMGQFARFQEKECDNKKDLLKKYTQSLEKIKDNKKFLHLCKLTSSLTREILESSYDTEELRNEWNVSIRSSREPQLPNSTFVIELDKRPKQANYTKKNLSYCKDTYQESTNEIKKEVDLIINQITQDDLKPIDLIRKDTTQLRAQILNRNSLHNTNNMQMQCIENKGKDETLQVSNTPNIAEKINDLKSKNISETTLEEFLNSRTPDSITFKEFLDSNNDEKKLIKEFLHGRQGYKTLKKRIKEYEKVEKKKDVDNITPKNYTTEDHMKYNSNQKSNTKKINKNDDLDKMDIDKINVVSNIIDYKSITAELIDHDPKFTINYNSFKSRDKRGVLNMFNKSNGSSYYLLDIDNLIIHTNNSCIQDFTFKTDKKRYKIQYMISQFITGIMKFTNLIRRTCKEKIYKVMKRHMMIQHDAINNRLNAQNMKRTKTFFRFSHNKRSYYLGIYKKCHIEDCHVPTTEITRIGCKCHIHLKQHQRETCPKSAKGITQPVAYNFTEFCPNSNNNTLVKTICSNRYGYCYDKRRTNNYWNTNDFTTNNKPISNVRITTTYKMKHNDTRGVGNGSRKKNTQNFAIRSRPASTKQLKRQHRLWKQVAENKRTSLACDFQAIEKLHDKKFNDKKKTALQRKRSEITYDFSKGKHKGKSLYRWTGLANN
jgi:hypothetical protein